MICPFPFILTLIIIHPGSRQINRDSPGLEEREVTFSYRTASKTNGVAVVGQFNNWDRGANPLSYNKGSNSWSTKVLIPIGVYQYLYVINGSTWVPDPNAPVALDPNGNKNSLLLVQPASYDNKPGVVGDGVITTAVLSHIPSPVNTCRIDNNYAWVSLRTRAHDVASVNVVLPGMGEQFPASISTEDALFTTWKARFPINQQGFTKYYFQIKDGNLEVNHGRDGAHEGLKPIAFSQDLIKYPLPNEPNWISKAIIYQIFPDRFQNGDKSNDPPDVKQWGTLPTSEHWQIRLGGDLAGIIEKLPYLHDLGINCIYLNPIFSSLSNHGYDTVDYFKVDHRFGTNEELKELVHDAHAAGIRVILDGVFNHSSPQFFAFQDLLKNGSKSAYKNWYFIKRFPIKVADGQDTYLTFAGVPMMPKLNQANPATSEYFCKVGAYWIKYANVDGWRLDTADEVDQSFWREFRTATKKANPQAYLLGEEWGDAHEYLQGDEHDAVMNYRLRAAVLDYFVTRKTTASEFSGIIAQIRSDYPIATLNAQYNLLGSHDTPRVRTLCNGDLDREEQALVFQFTYPGVPAIYYGDEIGMEGGNDPDDRRPMIWDKSQWQPGYYSFFKMLIDLRKDHPELQEGKFNLIAADDKSGIFAYSRTYQGKTISVYFAGSQDFEITLTGTILVARDYAVTSGQPVLKSGGWLIVSG